MKAVMDTPMRAFLRRLRSGEDGFTMVLAVGFTAVLSITAATTITYATQNERSAQLQKADQLALSYAEAALARAYSTVYAASNPRDAGAVPERTVTFDRGTGTYSGTYANGAWALVGIGRVLNPANGSDIVRTVNGRMAVGSGSRGSANNAVWNYIYVDDLTQCTTLRNSVTVNVPLYVRGDLCLENSAQVGALAYALQVGGTLTLTNSAHVGSPGRVGGGTMLNEVHIAGGCRVDGGPVTSPCGPQHRVYSETPPDANVTGLTKPPVDLPYWYANSKPGPMHNCTVGSFPTPAGHVTGFDRDTTLNKNRAVVDLAPASAYNCEFWENGELVGQIKWQPGAPGTLTVKGTIYFDGSIEFRNSTNLVYVGRSTIYASGSITMRNSTKVCGVAGCGADWAPLVNLLAFVAGEDTAAIGFSAENSTTYQGAVYAVNDYWEGNSSVVWGPIIARRVFLQNSSTNFYVPIGTLLPGMPAQYEEVVVLSNEQGSWG